jgi:hypothetical protein
MARPDSLSVRDAAVLLGLPRTSFYSRLKELRPEKRRTSGRGAASDGAASDSQRYSVEDLLSSRAGKERIHDARALATAMSDSVICDARGTMLAIGAEIGRALQRAEEDLVGHGIESIGVPIDVGAGCEVLLLGNRWLGSELPKPVVLRRRSKAPANPVAPEVPIERHKEALEKIRAIQKKYPGTAWVAELCREAHPDLGFDNVSAYAIRTFVGKPDEGFAIYRLTLRSPAAFITDELSKQSQLRFSAASAQFKNTCDTLVRDLASLLSAESVTCFFFRHSFASQEFDVADHKAKRRALVALAQYGFPPSLATRELFSPEEPSLVVQVLSRGRIEIVDFAEEGVIDLLRLPNASNFALTSLFRKLGNAIIAPIALQPATSTETPLLYGAIRVLNCYRVDKGGNRVLVDSPKSELLPMVPTVECVASRLALMNRVLLSTQRADLMRRAIGWLIDSDQTLDFFLQLIVRTLRDDLDFDRAVIWNTAPGDPSKVTLRFPVGSTRRGQFRGDCMERKSAEYAIEKGSMVDIESELVPLLEAEGNGSSLKGPHNGFEIPLLRANGEPWGTLGLYDSWAVDQHDTGRDEVRELCINMGKLIEARIAAEPDPDGKNSKGTNGY